MPAGRPSKYDPSFCATVIATGEQGGTLAEMARACKVDRSTINDWMEQHPEFSRAIKAGLDEAQAWWEDMGRKGTFGGTEGFNATAYIFQMKNRFKADWRDTQAVDHTSSDGSMTPKGIDATKLSDETLREILAARDATDAK